MNTINKDVLFENLENAYRIMCQLSYPPKDTAKLSEAAESVSTLYKQYFSPPYDKRIDRAFETLYHFRRWGKEMFDAPSSNHESDMESITNAVREFYAEYIKTPHIRIGEALEYVKLNKPEWEQEFVFCTEHDDKNELLVLEKLHAYCDYDLAVKIMISVPMENACFDLPVVSDLKTLDERPCVFDFFGRPVWTHPNKCKLYNGRERSEYIYSLSKTP